jgi:hypothetical protein
MDKLTKHPNLKHGKAFDEDVTKFYAASVVLAFEKLHNSMIAYRDMKPVSRISSLHCLMHYLTWITSLKFIILPTDISTFSAL